MSMWAEGLHDVRSRTIQLFIPSVDRQERPIDPPQEFWVEEALRVFGTVLGGATAFPPSRGVWRDDERGTTLVYDSTVIVFSYFTDEDMNQQTEKEILRFAKRLGREANQGEVGLYVDGRYYPIRDFTDEPEDREQ
jgi:hypothetical protein